MDVDLRQVPAALQQMVAEGEKHWKEFLPKKYAALKASGKLREELTAAAELAYQELDSLMTDRAMDWSEARDVAMQHHIRLPEEFNPDEEQMGRFILWEAMRQRNQELKEQDLESTYREPADEPKKLPPAKGGPQGAPRDK